MEWFKNPKKIKSNSKKVNLFTPIKITPMKINKTSSKKKIGYLGYSIKKMKPLFRGTDKDFDGSPDKFDCSPKDVSKDGVFERLIYGITGGRTGQSAEEYEAEKKAKRFHKRLSADMKRMKSIKGDDYVSEARKEAVAERIAKQIVARRNERIDEENRKNMERALDAKNASPELRRKVREAYEKGELY